MPSLSGPAGCEAAPDPCGALPPLHITREPCRGQRPHSPGALGFRDPAQVRHSPGVALTRRGQGLCEKEDQQERPQRHGGGGCLHGRERPQDTSLLGCGLSLLLLGLCHSPPGRASACGAGALVPTAQVKGGVRAPCSEPAALLAQLQGMCWALEGTLGARLSLWSTVQRPCETA